MDGVDLASPISSNLFSTVETPTIAAKAAPFADDRKLTHRLVSDKNYSERFINGCAEGTPLENSEQGIDTRSQRNRIVNRHHCGRECPRNHSQALRSNSFSA
jgi:hypothetical protein